MESTKVFVEQPRLAGYTRSVKYIYGTVSGGKGFGFRGKQHHKQQPQRRRATPSNPTKCKENHGIFPRQLIPGINTSLSTTELGLPSTAWQ